MKQHWIGNCYFYAAVGSLLATDPNAVRKLITEERDGTFTVRFPGRKVINVKAPSEAEIFLFRKPGQTGVWMWVLEKAYGEYCKSDPGWQEWRKHLGRKETSVPQENTEGPSLMDDGLQVLTGKPIEWVFNLPQKRMIERLESLFSESPRRPVTADSTFNVVKDNTAAVWGHTYSVLNYNYI